MKKLISLLLTLALVLPGAAAFAAVPGEDKEIEFDSKFPPFDSLFAQQVEEAKLDAELQDYIAEQQRKLQAKLDAVSTPTPGEAIGAVLYSDIVAYINGFPIRSYNIDGVTYVIVEDLPQYGFSVQWIPEGKGRLVIDPVHRGFPVSYPVSSAPVKNTHPVGSPAMPYYYTEITTWIGRNQIDGYNIGGYTCVSMDDLADSFAASYTWVPSTKSLLMTTKRYEKLLNSDYYGRVPAAEQYVSDSIIDLAELISLIMQLSTYYSSDLADSDSLYPFTEDDYGNLMENQLWDTFYNNVQYQVTGSRLLNNGTADVFVNIYSPSFTDCYKYLIGDVITRSMSGQQYNEDDFVLLLSQMLCDQRFVSTYSFTLNVEQYGYELTLSDTSDYETLITALTGDIETLIDILPVDDIINSGAIKPL